MTWLRRPCPIFPIWRLVKLELWALSLHSETDSTSLLWKIISDCLLWVAWLLRCIWTCLCCLCVPSHHGLPWQCLSRCSDFCEQSGSNQMIVNTSFRVVWSYLLISDHMMRHVSQVLEVSLSRVYAWTDSTIVLNWLDGSRCHFKMKRTWELELCQWPKQSSWLCLKRTLPLQAPTTQIIVEWTLLAQVVTCQLAQTDVPTAKQLAWRRKRSDFVRELARQPPVLQFDHCSSYNN